MPVADDAKDPSPDEDGRARPARQQRPEDGLREIEQETAHLAQTIDHARDAVRRAQSAGSMAAPGEDYSGFTEEWDPARGSSGEPDESGESDEESDGEADTSR